MLSPIKRKTAAQRDVLRPRIALWAHEGHSNTVIARERGTSVQTVSAWRKRVAQRRAQDLLECERSGRPPPITQESRLQLTALACEAQEPEGRVTPALDEIVARAIEHRIVGRISRSHQMEFPGLSVANRCIVIEAPTSSGTHVAGVR